MSPESAAVLRQLSLSAASPPPHPKVIAATAISHKVAMVSGTEVMGREPSRRAETSLKLVKSTQTHRNDPPYQR